MDTEPNKYQPDFDTVSRALVRQGRPAVHPRSGDPEHPHGFMCAYLASDGARCAAGHLLTDVAVDVLRELMGATCDVGVRPLLEAGGHDISFAGELQMAHDGPTIDFYDKVNAEAWLIEWVDRMRGVARRYGLDTAVLEAELLARQGMTVTVTATASTGLDAGGAS